MLEQPSTQPARNSPLTPFLAGLLVASAAVAAAYYFGLLHLASSPATPAMRITPHAAPATAAGAASLAALVAEEAATLDVQPHKPGLTTDKAFTAVAAMRRGDYRSADAMAQSLLAQSKLQAFSFHPFDRFIEHLSAGSDPEVLGGLNAWVSHASKPALAYLIRAKYLYDTAWLIRGADFSSEIPDERLQSFHDNLQRADDDVHKSITLDSSIPWSYNLQLEISAVVDEKITLQQKFDAAIARFPNYYPLYSVRLYYLEPKWGGSADAMHQFVEQYAGHAPASSDLNLLYMQLTTDLLDSAWVDCRSLKHEALTACMDTYMNRYITGGVTAGVAKALKLYKYSDPVQYSAGLWPILSDMVNTQGDTTSINAVLQLASEAMGSNNELVHDSRPNNYVIDEITARLWSNLGNSNNVEQKFRDALNDVAQSSFASEDDKAVTLGAIFDDMTWVARNDSQYIKVIAYHDAANAVAGENRDGTQFNKCFAYLQLHHYQQAVDECTLLIDTHRGVMLTHSYRAQANQALSRYDAAIAEYAYMADNAADNDTRTNAVINLGHTNVLKGNIAGERDVFEKYPFVFNVDIQSPEQLAIVYNNRCFAFMNLGEPKKALADCNTSLKYGRLPDALHKQQELVKLLSQKPT